MVVVGLVRGGSESGDGEVEEEVVSGDIDGLVLGVDHHDGRLDEPLFDVDRRGGHVDEIVARISRHGGHVFFRLFDVVLVKKESKSVGGIRGER